MGDDKYFYIAVPREQFHEVKHTFYEAPSNYLKVYDFDYIAQLERHVKHLEQLVEERAKALEWIDEYRELNITCNAEDWRLARAFEAVEAKVSETLRKEESK